MDVSCGLLRADVPAASIAAKNSAVCPLINLKLLVD